MFSLRTKLIGLAILAIVAFGALKWYGHTHFKAGVASRDAFWQPKFDAAEKARLLAEARVKVLEGAAKTITSDIEARHADILKTLADRASTAERSLTASLRNLASCSGRRELPALPGPASVPDAAPEGDERLAASGRSIAATGRDCESDAATVSGLQEWIRRQQSLMNSAP